MTEATNADGREAFLAAERAKATAEWARRKQLVSKRVTAGVLAEIEEQQVAEQPDDAEEYDPWLNLLENVEARVGVKVTYTTDGRREYRVATRYLLEGVLGVEPQRCNFSSASVRLGKLMRRLNWTGPKDLRMRGPVKKARGYCKIEEKAA